MELCATANEITQPAHRPRVVNNDAQDRGSRCVSSLALGQHSEAREPARGLVRARCILGKEPLARTDEQGRYSIALPRTAQHEISVFAEYGRSRAAQVTVLDDGRGERELDFEIE